MIKKLESTLTIVLLILIFGLFYSGCKDQISSSEQEIGGEVSSLAKGNPLYFTFDCNADCTGEQFETPLVAGQNEFVGKIVVKVIDIDGVKNLRVAFVCDQYGWNITESHLHFGTPDNGYQFPLTNKGNPKIGNFEYSHYSDPPIPVDRFTFTIDELGLSGGDCILIAAHASLVKVVDGNVIQEETGWGQGKDFPGNNWAMYFSYKICLQNEPPEPECPPAYAWEGQMSLCFPPDVTWGWTNQIPRGFQGANIKLMLFGQPRDQSPNQCFPYFPRMIGTVTISKPAEVPWELTQTVNVTYEMNPGSYLNAAHVYVGRSPFPLRGDPPVPTFNVIEYTIHRAWPPPEGPLQSYTFENVRVEGSEMPGPLFIIAHACYGPFIPDSELPEVPFPPPPPPGY